jgi:hypothetical protein
MATVRTFKLANKYEREASKTKLHITDTAMLLLSPCINVTVFYKILYIKTAIFIFAESQSRNGEDRNGPRAACGRTPTPESRRYCRRRIVRSGYSTACSGTSHFCTVNRDKLSIILILDIKYHRRP